ncbi:MAG: hypothetical protein KDA25_07845, partial [Phycisphaerales bacterium]|nr:hypothetical protein [Phycisphaerales bacterium]
IDGDGEPMREVVGAGIPLDWPERLGAHLRERLAPLGPLGPVEVMGTTTAGPASTTTVRFVGRDGRVAMALHWTGDALFRIGFVARYAREFGAYPTGRGALVAVDPETGRQVRLRFRRDAGGTVTALEIRSAAGDVLLRLRPAG